MEWDAEGLVVASPPWALVAKDEPFALFYDKRENKGNRPTLLKDIGNYNVGSKYFVLTYNVHWKGLVPQAAGSSFPFVCKNKTTDRFFITSSSGVLSEGPAKCKASNGLFVPPESGLDWSKLMLELNSNDDYYPFPDPDLKSHNIANNSFVYRKNFTNEVNGGKKAWVALQTISGNKAAEKAGIRASELKLYSGNFTNSDSIFKKDTKQGMIDVLFDANRFTDADVKNKYVQEPIAVMTTSGLVPASGSSGVQLIEELLKIDEIDENNARSKTKLLLADYKQVCLSNENDEWIPVGIHDFGSDCPNGGVTMDIGNSLANSYTFKPISYKYMSHWIKNIGMDDNEYVILTGGKLEERVKSYNDKIDCLIDCDCDSQYLPCPTCESVAGTCGAPPNTYVCYSMDCSAKQQCEAEHTTCKSDCDSKKATCGNDE